MILKGFPPSNTFNFGGSRYRYPTICKICKTQEYDQTMVYEDDQYFYYCKKCLNPPKQLLFNWEKGSGCEY